MADNDPPSVDIFVDPQLPERHERPIVDALAELGFTARIRVIPHRRAADQLQWLVLAALPLHAFLSGIGTKIAEDGYRGLKDAIRKVLSRPDAPEPRPMVLQDAASGLQIVLDHDLPDDGYRQLLELDLAQFQLGPIHYDRARRRWRSDLDEARPR